MKFANGAVTRPNDKIKAQKEWIVQIFNRKTQGYKQTDPDKCDFQQPARRTDRALQASRQIHGSDAVRLTWNFCRANKSWGSPFEARP